MLNFDIEELRKAEAMAMQYHEGQTMKDSETPYIVHCYRVLIETMNALCLSPQLDMRLGSLCAILHDTLEDTVIGEEEIALNFGEEVLAGVKALSKAKDLPKEKQLEDSLQRIAMEKDEIKIVKMCDRIVNLAPPPKSWSRDKISKYLSDSLRIHEILGSSHGPTEKRLMEKIENYKKYTQGEDNSFAKS